MKPIRIVRGMDLTDVYLEDIGYYGINWIIDLMEEIFLMQDLARLAEEIRKR